MRKRKCKLTWASLGNIITDIAVSYAVTVQVFKKSSCIGLLLVFAV